jgi:hypothetical protein
MFHNRKSPSSSDRFDMMGNNINGSPTLGINSNDKYSPTS